MLFTRYLLFYYSIAENPRLFGLGRGRLILGLFLRVLKLLPLFLQIKLFGSKLFLLIEQCLLEIVHLVQLLSKQVLVLHVVGQEDVVVSRFRLEFLQNRCLVLTYIKMLLFRPEPAPPPAT